jgi:MutS domain V/MutS domain III
MDILDDYRQRAAAAQREISKYERLVNTYSLLRLVVFALMIFAIFLATKTIGIGLLVTMFIILLLCFVWLVSRQSYFLEQKNYFIALKIVCENEIASITDGSNIYDIGEAFYDEKHPYTSDLDIFGKGSLFQLVNRSATTPGKKLLSSWFSAPSSKNTILNRQQSLEELSSKNDWKLDYQAKLLFANKTDPNQLSRLVNYLKLKLELSGESFLRSYIKIAPLLLLAAIIAGYFYAPISILGIAVAVFNVSILVFKGSYIMKSDGIADKIGKTLANYTIVFKAIESEQWQSESCSLLASQLKVEATSKKIKELSKLISNLQLSGIFFVGFVLNVFFLWALKQIIAIEDWKRNNAQSFEAAFDVIAEFEALISLSSLRINYPEWCMPEIVESDGYTLTAKGLAHPLINSSKRVENDYELDNDFKIDIITGSNMAGKSTFLRTIGINAVLALCGAPVCAKQMKISVITIISYMRIKDNLNESTSTFKAELDRLQMLLAAVENDNKVFFLIDEMLRGTNSVDKYLGSKAIIEQLIRKNGVGLVATHDLQIAELEHAHPNYIRNFYFDIQVKDGDMLFDYKIKPGACKTFNASLLLKQIGIDI